MALRTRIDSDSCPDCGGSWLIVEHRMHAQDDWRQVQGSCLRRCEQDRDRLDEAS